MKKILLTQGKFALVDNEDFEYLNQWKWGFDNGYARRTVNYRKPCGKRTMATVFMHRLILCVDGKNLVDHVDGDGLNNQKNNLRLCNHSQNARNQKAKRISMSGFKGVHLHNGRWCARIMVDNKRVHLGYFNEREQAAKAYNAAAKKHFGEFARINQL